MDRPSTFRMHQIFQITMQPIQDSSTMNCVPSSIFHEQPWLPIMRAQNHWSSCYFKGMWNVLHSRHDFYPTSRPHYRIPSTNNFVAMSSCAYWLMGSLSLFTLNVIICLIIITRWRSLLMVYRKGKRCLDWGDGSMATSVCDYHLLLHLQYALLHGLLSGEGLSARRKILCSWLIELEPVQRSRIGFKVLRMRIPINW